MISTRLVVTRVAVLALALSLATSCTGTPSSSPTSSTPAVSLPSPRVSPSLTGAAGAVQTAVAAYRGMWQAYETVAQNPDLDQPQLREFATGTALQTITNGLKSLNDQGLKGTGSVVHNPQVTKISPSDAPTEVDVSDCMDTSASHIVRAVPGPVYSDSPGGRRLCLAVVQRQSDGSWKVTTFGVRAVGTC